MDYVNNADTTDANAQSWTYMCEGEVYVWIYLMRMSLRYIRAVL